MPAFGSLSIHLALLAAVLAAPLFLRAGHHGGLGLATARRLMGGAAALLTVALSVLALAALTHDYRIEYVASYTDRTTAIAYLLSSVWAGQAGSLLVWTTMLAWMGVALSGRLRKNAPALEAPALGFLALNLAFFAFVLVGWSNPFSVTPGQPPVDGNGLNPLLRNWLMIFHPPALLAGYAAYAPPAAIAAAALLSGDMDDKGVFLRELRHWSLLAWVLLTVGNVLGMVWAYGELGWGGYWGWDPVENASLIPWITGTALLHVILAERRGRVLVGYGAVLALVTFWLTILGTYLTRSGIVASVHAFGRTAVADAFAILLAVVAATVLLALILRRRMLTVPSPGALWLVGRAAVMASIVTVGVFELEGYVGVLAIPILLALLVGWRAFRASLQPTFGVWLGSYVLGLAAAGVVEPVLWLPGGGCALVLLVLGLATKALDERSLGKMFSRAVLLTATALLLVNIALSVLFGTLLPVLSQTFIGESVQVDAAWYSEWAAPAGLLLLATTGFCLSFGWKGPRWKTVAGRLLPALSFGLLAGSIAWALGVTSPLALGAIALAALTAVAALIRLRRVFGSLKSGDKARPWTRAVGSAGAIVAHLGLAVFLFGVAGEADKREETLQLSRGEEVAFGPYRLELESLGMRGELEREVLGAVVLARNASGQVVTLRPERHRYRTHSGQPTSEAAVHTTIASDLFLTLGEADVERQQVWVRALMTPLLPWIWVGCTLMALGGLLAVIIAVRPSKGGVIVYAAMQLVAAVVWLVWRPSAAMIVVAAFFLALALWWLGQAFLRPLWQPAPAAPRCPKCDKKLVRGSDFCHHCGAQVGSDD